MVFHINNNIKNKCNKNIIIIIDNSNNYYNDLVYNNIPLNIMLWTGLI